MYIYNTYVIFSKAIIIHQRVLNIRVLTYKKNFSPVEIPYCFKDKNSHKQFIKMSVGFTDNNLMSEKND